MYNPICLVGVDGSGKTEQIRLLMKLLTKEGFKCKYVWFRWAAFISYPFLALCRLSGLTRRRVNPRSGSFFSEHCVYRSRTLAKIWTLLFTFDLYLYCVFRIKVPIKIGYHVLCDRFVLDAIVDLMHDTRNYDLARSAIGNLLMALIPKQSIVILLDVDEYEAYKRKEDIPSIDYLKQRRESYLRLCQDTAVQIVDGNKTPDEVHREIANKVLKNCRHLMQRS